MDENSQEFVHVALHKKKTRSKFIITVKANGTHRRTGSYRHALLHRYLSYQWYSTQLFFSFRLKQLSFILTGLSTQN